MISYSWQKLILLTGLLFLCMGLFSCDSAEYKDLPDYLKNDLNKVFSQFQERQTQESQKDIRAAPKLSFFSGLSDLKASAAFSKTPWKSYLLIETENSEARVKLGAENCDVSQEKKYINCQAVEHVFTPYSIEWNKKACLLKSVNFVSFVDVKGESVKMILKLLYSENKYKQKIYYTDYWAQKGSEGHTHYSSSLLEPVTESKLKLAELMDELSKVFADFAKKNPMICSQSEN